MSEDFNFDANKLTNNNANDNRLACIFHLLAFINLLLPPGGIIALLVYRAYDNKLGAYALMHWRESMNFQISVIIYALIFTVLVFILIGIPLLGLLFLFSLVMPVIAAIKTMDGQPYKYPMIFRLV